MHDQAATRISGLLISRSAFMAAVRGAGSRLGHPRGPLGPNQPLPGFPEAWGLSRQDVVDIAAGLLIVVLLTVVLSIRVGRRHRTEQATARAAPVPIFPATAETWRSTGLAEPVGTLPRFEASTLVAPHTARSPGWYPVHGDPGRLCYWDGSSWTAAVRWDGQRWVDSTTTP
jgi:hypothetical protein